MPPDQSNMDGLAFFTDAVLEPALSGPTVFGRLDEDAVAARFGVVSDDDLGSDFFSDHGIHVDSEARRAFQESLAAMGRPEAEASGGPGGRGEVAAPKVAGLAPASPSAAPGSTSSALTAEQRDFILFGPRI